MSAGNENSVEKRMEGLGVTDEKRKHAKDIIEDRGYFDDKKFVNRSMEVLEGNLEFSKF